MKTLALDGHMGASGDMLLGALVAVGADPGTLTPVEESLDVTYRFESVTRAGIGATACSVVRRTDDGTAPIEGHGPARTLEAVLAIVADMDLPEPVYSRAVDAFERLAAAEAAVHDEPIDTIHFHEVGADDAIADIVGCALLLEDLGPDRVVVTPLSTGTGTVEMAHGTYPLPGPAVVAIVEDTSLTIRGGPVEGELLTPTGAAILATIASGVDTVPTMRVAASGYGAGSRAVPGRPNVLRAMLGETRRGLTREPIAVLETAIDDTTPEILGGLQASLREVGALDVSIVPLTMKKARPGHLVQVITRPADAERVADRLARETGTLGVRVGRSGHRWVADRERHTVTLDIEAASHEVDVKVASDRDGRIIDVSAEYDDAAVVARHTGRPVREVLHLAEARAREQLRRDDQPPPDR